MTPQLSDQPIAPPSKGALAKAASLALLMALLLLFAFVLPAEYGFDPLKTGAALKLTGISQSEPAPAKGATPTPAAGSNAVYTPQERIFKVDSEDFLLRPNEGMEMKYHMQKGATFVY